MNYEFEVFFVVEVSGSNVKNVTITNPVLQAQMWGQINPPVQCWIVGSAEQICN